VTIMRSPKTIEILKYKYKILKKSTVNTIIETKNGYKINQIDYIDKIINSYNMNKTKTIKTQYIHTYNFSHYN